MLNVILPTFCIAVRWVCEIKHCYIRRYSVPYSPVVCRSGVLRLQMIQVVQNKTLRGVVHSPWYRRNTRIHQGFKIPPTRSAIKNQAITSSSIIFLLYLIMFFKTSLSNPIILRQLEPRVKSLTLC